MLVSGCSKYWSRLSSGMACMTQLRARVEGVQAELDAVMDEHSRRGSKAMLGVPASSHSASLGAPGVPPA